MSRKIPRTVTYGQYTLEYICVRVLLTDLSKMESGIVSMINMSQRYLSFKLYNYIFTLDKSFSFVEVYDNLCYQVIYSLITLNGQELHE